MATVKAYISYSRRDQDLAKEVAQKLRELGYEITLDVDALQPGQIWRDVLDVALVSADVFICLLTGNSLESQSVMMELGAARSFSRVSKKMLLLPILFDDIEIPLVISDILVLKADREDVESTILSVQNAISEFLGHRAAGQQKEEAVQERIESKAATFVQEAIDSLEKQEERNRLIGNGWYGVGFLALVSGIAFAFYSTSKFAEVTELEWVLFAYLALKSLFVIGLLIATTKYCFTLGKSYISESLKSADRIHAIAFGKFYLNVFGSKATWAELKEVFQHWNIDRTSSFSGLTPNDFDPKIVESIVEIAKAASSKIEIKK